MCQESFIRQRGMHVRGIAVLQKFNGCDKKHTPLLVLNGMRVECLDACMHSGVLCIGVQLLGCYMWLVIHVDQNNMSISHPVALRYRQTHVAACVAFVCDADVAFKRARCHKVYQLQRGCNVVGELMKHRRRPM